METENFLPVGSVVVLEGGIKKVAVIARGVAVKNGEEMQYFEYGGCLYPEGMTGDSILYFNQENIMKVVAEGYSDEDDVLMSQNTKKWIKQKNYKKGDPYNWDTQGQVNNNE